MAGCTPFLVPDKPRFYRDKYPDWKKKQSDKPPAVYHAPTEKKFPMLEVRGDHYELGFLAGKRFSAEIRQALEERGPWWKDLKTFVKSQYKGLLDNFLVAAQFHTPLAVEELKGWAKGCGLPFDDLLTLNLKCELGAIKDRVDQESGHKKPGPGKVSRSPAGCSTVVYKQDDRLIIVHNEDGHEAFAKRMFLLRRHPQGKPSVLCASYPGILPGNAPWINDHGVCMTSNFIYSKAVRVEGVGRYFVDNQAMGAETLEDAAHICNLPKRAYTYHHIIGSRSEKRAATLEAGLWDFSLQKISGLYVHTNHFTHPELAGEEQDARYVKTSSTPRLEALQAWMRTVPADKTLSMEDLVGALASHYNRPYSPCRHPQGDVRGATLLTTAMDLGQGILRVYKGQPCQKVFAQYPFPRKA